MNTVQKGISTAPVNVSIPSLKLSIHIPAGTECRKLGERAYWQVSDITSDASLFGVRIPDVHVTIH